MIKNILIVIFSALLFLSCSHSKQVQSQSKQKHLNSLEIQKNSKSLKKTSKTKVKTVKRIKKVKSFKNIQKLKKKRKVRKIKQIKSVQTRYKTQKRKKVKKAKSVQGTKTVQKTKSIQKTHKVKKRKIKKKTYKVQTKIKKTASKPLKTVKKTQKRLPIMLEDNLSQASERYLIYTLHKELIYLQEALNISSMKTKRVSTVKQALNFQAFSKDATLIYLMDIKKFNKIKNITSIGQHFARKSFWFISYRKNKDVQKYKKANFNGLKTNLIFIHNDDITTFIQNMKEQSTLKQLIKSSCFDEKECRNFRKGNDYLLY